MKRKIKLTEQDIVRMVKRALNESDWRTFANASKKADKGHNPKRAKKFADYSQERFDKTHNINKHLTAYPNDFDDDSNGYMFSTDRYAKISPYTGKIEHDNVSLNFENGDDNIEEISNDKTIFNKNGVTRSYTNGDKHEQYTMSHNYVHDNPLAYPTREESNASKELAGYYSGRDKYEPGKGWPKYGEQNESLNRRVKKSIRESLRRMNESEGDVVYVNDEEDGRTVRVYSIPSNDYYGYPINFGVYNDQDDTQSDLELIVAFAEKNGYESIFADEDAEEAYKESLKETGDEDRAWDDLDDWYIYIDATMDGAKGTHFIYNNIGIN